MADDKMDVIFTSSVDDCIDDGQFADQSNNMRVFLAMDHDRSTFKFDPGRIIVTTGIIERFIPEAHMGRDKIAPLDRKSVV